MNDIKLSKLLSLVLRHQPDAIGIQLDEEGWADIADLLKCLKQRDQSITREQLQRVVAENSKQRFRFSDDGQQLRANQGHSIQIDLKLEPKPAPESLYHGTATRFLNSILSEGLNPGSRQHVHLSVDVETATAVGSRHGKPVVLTVASGQMQAGGHVFYLSENGVWLTDRVPPEFITENA